jgi:hypothetical protein
MTDKDKDKQTDAATEATPSAAVADTSAASEAAESAGIVGAGATASGFASDNLGEKTLVKDAENGIQDGPLARLDEPSEAFLEQGRGKVFTQDEQGRGQVSIRSDIAANPSADYPGRDAALAATNGGRDLPGNLDAILRAQHAGTQVPGDAQLMSQEEIDALKEAFVDNIEPKAANSGAGTRFVEKEGDPNSITHEKEVNPNIPTNEKALKGVRA